MIIGHQRQRKIFQNLIDKEKLTGSFIFFGEPQTGKFTFAKFLAERLEPQNRTLSETLFIEPDEKNTIGIEAARGLKSFLSRKPVNSYLRTVVIDSAQSLTPEAQNAILKIAEEPPLQSLMILIVANPESLLPTIASRFQKVYFERVKAEEIETWLIGEHKLGSNQARQLSRLCFGRPGLAMELIREKRLDFNNLLTPADYQSFIKKEIISLYEDKLKNTAGLKELLKRLAFIESLNTNKKLQLQAALWNR
jgi:DNA polymerase-3 subunit delta'